MKAIRYIIYGIIFSIILIKVEAISWFRIQEMFYFESFHMYGVLFSGIVTALIGVQLLKYKGIIDPQPKPLQLQANILGGLSFGIGWGITGACTGPVYALLGLNVWPVTVVFAGAILGTFIYALTKNRLPHHYEKGIKTHKNTSSAYS